MTRQVNISEAKAQLSALIAGLETTGERVVICRNGRVVAELVRPTAGPLVIGARAGTLDAPIPDLFAEDAEVLRDWGEVDA